MTESLRGLNSIKNIDTPTQPEVKRGIPFPNPERDELEFKILRTPLLADTKITPFLKRLEAYDNIPLANDVLITGKKLREAVEDHLRISPSDKTKIKYPLVELDIEGFPEFNIHLMKLVRDAENLNSIYPENKKTAPQKSSGDDLPPIITHETLSDGRSFTTEERHPDQKKGLTDSHYKKYIENGGGASNKEGLRTNNVKRGMTSTFMGRLKGVFGGVPKYNDEADDDFIGGNYFDDINNKKDSEDSEDILLKSVEDTMHTEWLKKQQVLKDREAYTNEQVQALLSHQPSAIKAKKLKEAQELKKEVAKKNPSWLSRLIHRKEKVATITSPQEENDSTFNNPEHFIKDLEGLYEGRGMSQKIEVQLSPEQKSKIAAVEEKTKNLREKVMEKLGNKGKTFLSLCDKGSDFLKANVSGKTRIFASAGLITAGTLSVAASVAAGPVVLTAIGITSLAMRAISAAGTYQLIRGALEKNYEAREKNGEKVSSLQKGFYGASALVIAAGAGLAIGNLFEYLATAVENSIISEKELLEMSKTAIPSDVAGEVVTETRSIPQVMTENSPIISPEIITPPLEVLHTVIRNENLWSIMRKTLETIDYEGFSHLSRGVQEAKISLLIDKIAEDPKSFGVMSGKIDLIRTGETINLTKLFTK